MQHAHGHERDDFHQRAIPAIPRPRSAQPAEDWNTARATRIPRQPGPDHTDNN
ncbi:hypothetical protein [Streptomyces xanthophaeus]|uniref:hypothetical protein n=1 Tax=Streptomyces xanthophaeus TaxID=67385 RepID=UPI00370FDF7D